ncbi:MAG: four helix bundle protein [Patescibacteria group bacterium]|nr:four helix bundle protein [Patescibacteria group bacterium]MDD5295104.1 four helix bundle protein [Patescibacteria group bacterium]MDD5554691.1 four helix bundle protein [Patescibacteria group bacterium]
MATGLENLKIYKLSVRLEIFLHKVLKEKFPPEEKYRSVDQLKRSSSSVSNNIAESYGRYSYGVKIKHLYIARGEAEETRSGMQRANKKGFVSGEITDFTVNKYTELIKAINGYINFLKDQQNKNN